MTKGKTIDFITLGCSKNLVDSERLMGMFEQAGYHCTHDADRTSGDIVVINTCGFIEDAKQESIDTILQYAQAKDEGRISRLFVMGCLSQRYPKELRQEIPQVDKYYGKFDYTDLLADLKAADAAAATTAQRHLTTPAHYAYIKISEGCARHCAYCAIPLITGRHVSRTVEDVLAEVAGLVDRGVSEFQIIAQELTYYGIDLDGRRHIAELIDRMASIPGVRWIRLHYAYPAGFPWELLDVMARHPNVCKYIDIALQHISDNMLTRMRRHITKDETYELIRRMRAALPGLHIRTTLMVGFPGETEDDFAQLLDFVKWARFERMGAFAYSEEDGTYSADNYTDDVPPETKQRRLDKLMAVQQSISAEVEAAKIGTRMLVVVDRREGEYFIARSEYCSPEVDPEVLIAAGGLEIKPGEYHEVEVTDADEFDVYARLV